MQPTTNLYIIADKGRRASVYGIGTYLRMLVGALKQASGLRVHVVEINTDRTRVDIVTRDGVEYWSIPACRIEYADKAKEKTLYFKNVVYLLRLYMKEMDNLVFHLNYTESYSLAEALRLSFDCTITLAVHYLTWQFEFFGNLSRMKKLLNRDVQEMESGSDRDVYRSFLEEQKMLAMADAVICLSLNTAEILSTLYGIEPSRISVIYNGLEDGRTVNSDSKAALRLKYRLPSQAPVVIFAGRLDPIKGVSTVLQTALLVLEKFPDAHFFIAGSGDYDTYLKECEGRWMNIHFTGLVEREQLYELYGLSDVGIMASFHEQCSYVAIEMMMHGLPLVGTTSTGLGEMIEQGKTGYAVAVRETAEEVTLDPTLMAERVIYLLENESARKELGRGARERYEELYTLECMGEKMSEFYAQIAVDLPASN